MSQSLINSRYKFAIFISISSPNSSFPFTISQQIDIEPTRILQLLKAKILTLLMSDHRYDFSFCSIGFGLNRVDKKEMPKI